MTDAETIVTHSLGILHSGTSSAVNDKDEAALGLRTLPFVVKTLEREGHLLSQDKIDKAYLLEKAYQSVLVGYVDENFWSYGDDSGDIRTADVSYPIVLTAADGAILQNIEGEDLTSNEDELVVNADEVVLPITNLLAYELRRIIHQDTQQMNEMRQLKFEAKTFLRERMNRITRHKPTVMSGYDSLRRARIRRMVNMKVRELEQASMETAQ